MSAAPEGSITRRRLLATGGSAAALAVAASSSFGLGGAGGQTGLIFAVGCCPAPEAGGSASGRVSDSARIAGSLPRVEGRWASLSLLAFHAARSRTVGGGGGHAVDLGDFADADLLAHIRCAGDEERPVVLWGCRKEQAASVAPGIRMNVPIGRTTAIPISLEIRRRRTPFARRLNAAAQLDESTAEHGEQAGDMVVLTQRLELPLRVGTYVVAGRRTGSGRLPSWDACRVATSVPDGAITLETHGLGHARPVDFPYLVIRVDHVTMPQAVAIS